MQDINNRETGGGDVKESIKRVVYFRNVFRKKYLGVILSTELVSRRFIM